MLIIAIDDEPKALRLLHEAIAEARPEAEIMDFPLGTAAIRAIERDGLRPAAVFTDIHMPEMDGLALAARLKLVSPGAKVVFVTEHQEYALDALRLHVSGYILKPLTQNRMREEMNHALPAPSEEKLSIRCFGQFEVFWKGRPLMFGRRQTKELLAYLVDQNGVTCTAEKIAAALWESETDMPALKHRIRDLISDLKKTLAAIGMADIIVRRSGQAAIQRDRVDCDYFRMLDGDMGAANAYRGEYMAQYSWAEQTRGRLHFGGV